ncbi:STAS domain-containing protein [Actinoplanes utahensis]|uniref:STAS domain-containing protein n=1 Tax=Actinoplanes utahensis TaxID=1869 RepID=UPI000AD72FCE|nr:STAS domain-containing protein [Actinoplanes utahensis]GIF33455.1 hypothetical protein Aut01nite_64410 [Actinoplanes utahensis]
MRVVPVIDEHEDHLGSHARIMAHAMAGASVIRLVGDIDLEVAAALRTTLDTALTASPWAIVDLRQVGAVDSVGLGVLIAARHAARRQGGDVLLAAAPPFFLAVLRAARLGAVFSTFATVPQAITWALSPRAVPDAR